MALIHNPMEDVTGPLQRVEASLTQLCSDMGALDVLPSISAGIEDTNGRLARVEAEVALARAANERAAEALEAIRADLAESLRLVAGSLAPGDGAAPPDGSA